MTQFPKSSVNSLFEYKLHEYRTPSKTYAERTMFMIKFNSRSFSTYISKVYINKYLQSSNFISNKFLDQQHNNYYLVYNTKIL